MSSRKRNTLIMMIISLVLGVAVIISLVLLILQRTGLETITINPSFADTELDVNMDYIISVNTDPSGANIAKFDYESDSTAVTFEYKDDGIALLHTSGEGAVTVYVKSGKIESNKLTFNIVDKAAQAAAAAAQAQAEAEAAAAAEAEAAAAAEAEAAAAAQVRYIKCIKDNVNIRSSASTDGDVLGKAKLNDTFEVINDDGSWTEFKYGDKSGFMRNDMIEMLPEGETPSVTSPQESTQETEKKEETKKEETKKEETKKEEQTTEQTAEQKAAEEAKKQQEALPTATAASQPATEVVAPPVVADGKLPDKGAWSYQGVTFTANQVAHFHKLWDYTGDAAEMVTHHSAAELQQVCKVDGVN